MHFFRESKIEKFGGDRSRQHINNKQTKAKEAKQFKFHYKGLCVKNTDNYLKDSDQNWGEKIYCRKCDGFINIAGKRAKIIKDLRVQGDGDEDEERKQIRMGCWLCWHFLKKRRWKRLMRRDKKAENSGSGTNKQFKG